MKELVIVTARYKAIFHDKLMSLEFTSGSKVVSQMVVKENDKHYNNPSMIGHMMLNEILD